MVKTPLLLFLISLAVRLVAILLWQFDGLYGQDSFAYFQQGLAIANTLSPPGDFFWPNGYPLLIALASLATGQSALAGQLATLLCGALLSPLVYLLTTEMLGNETAMTEANCSHLAGVLAGIIVAVAGQPILSSIVVMADIPALFWATLSAWIVVLALRFEPGSVAGLYFLAAGATLALAIITRWLYVLIVPALGAYTLFQIHKNKHPWWVPLPAILSSTIILAPQLWLSLNKPGGLLHSWLLGWQPTNFLLRQFENIDGHFSYQLPVGIYYAQPAGHPAYIFPLLGLASLWGIWHLWQAKQWGPLILSLGWIGPVYLFLGGIPYQNFRFGLTLYVPFVILTGFGLAKLLAGLEQRRPSDPLRFRSPVLLKGLILFSLLGMLAWAYPMLHSFLTTQNRSKDIARQVEQTLPPKATLLTFGLTLTLNHYTKLNTVELFYFDESSLDTLTAAQPALYLLLDQGNVETQWPEKTPGINFRWLKENTTLTKVGIFSNYTLFKIEGKGSEGEGEQGRRGEDSPLRPFPPAPLLVHHPYPHHPGIPRL